MAKAIHVLPLVLLGDNSNSDFLILSICTVNRLEGDMSDVIALDQLTSPFSPRKATRMLP